MALVETQKPFVYEPTDNQQEGRVLIPSSILKLFASQESSNNSVVVTIIHYVNDSLFPSDENVSNVSRFITFVYFHLCISVLNISRFFRLILEETTV